VATMTFNQANVYSVYFSFASVLNAYYRYSCDEGISWSDFTFASSNIVLLGVRTEPGEITSQVLSVTT